MGETSREPEGNEKCIAYKNLVGKTEEMKVLGRLRFRL
jgi:hypothetical protein